VAGRIGTQSKPGASARLRHAQVVGKYLLIEVPGWLLVAALAWGARGWWGLPDWAAIAIVAAFVLKDLVLFPFVRHAYEVEMRENGSHLVGASACVEQSLAPEGWVRLGSELWRARSVGGEELPSGTRVCVEAVEGLTLRVTRAPERS
jgi:membrane protein implicated in regulation of membrane protease activity